MQDAFIAQERSMMKLWCQCAGIGRTGLAVAVACIPWRRLDTAFLDSAIFEALGFSCSMAEHSGAIQVATG